jgi:protein TonB
MVHTIRSFQHADTHQRLEPNRIAGLALAIALNAALLMLLLVPMHAPPLAMPTVTQVLQWVRTRPPVPAPLPPKPVPVTRTQPLAHATSKPAREVVVPTEDPPLLSTTGDTPATDGNATPPTIAPSGADPMPGVHLEYDVAPAPDYPRDALRAGIEGTVVLQVLVDIDGRPLKVDVQHSSGDRRLDAAARRQVLEHWRFRPAVRDGRGVQAIGLVPIAFKLQ